MAVPVLTPISTVSLTTLPSTGSHSEVFSSLPFGFYADPSSSFYSAEFVSGSVDEVSYVYRKLGGDVVDIELTTANVYAAYEEATMEYSYLVNLHQAKNSLSSLLGSQTASFDRDGTITSDLSGSNIALKYPKFNFGYANKVADYVATSVGIGGSRPIYSASFDIIENQQDYDLQDIIYSSSLSSSLEFYNKIGQKKVLVQKVFYKTPSAAWRFFGIYGGLNVMGNLMNYNLFSYGQYSDQTTYEVVPVWEHKLQARAYEDAIYTRCSHYSYELRNNKVRVYPIPTSTSITPSKFWVEFIVPDNTPWAEAESGIDTGVNGINNLNTLPFENLPFNSINSIGKTWIKKYALSICKEMLGQIRGKFQSLPIPNSSVVLNAEQLLAQAKEEKEILKKELMDTLGELTYQKIAEQEAKLAEDANKTLAASPNLIYVV